ncbi:MAG: type IX secretion system sortase PorU [candidate division Zixibacteria bacterium]|nr:type IX secretion system sortase PorU [candidate division Zixibacteria bacterium]
MNNYLYKALFISAFWLVCENSSGVIPAITVISSTETGFHCFVSINNDLSDLETVITSDSSRAWVKSILIGIPHGSQVRLLSANGVTSEPLEVSDIRKNVAQTTQASLPLAEISKPFTVRGRELVTVTIAPVNGNAVSTSVELKLSFEPTGISKSLGVAESDTRFEKVFASSVANYEQFVTWPSLSRAVRSSSSVSNGAAESPFLQSDEWFKIILNQSLLAKETDLFKISGAQLSAAGISLTNLSTADIRLFYAGGLPIEIDNSKPRPQLEEIPLIISDGGDGQFGHSDYFLFCGELIDRWVYRAGLSPQYINNIYTNDNIYWLTVTGVFDSTASRMSALDVTPTGTVDTLITSYTRDVRAEQDNILPEEISGHFDDYYEWHWTDQTSLQFFVPTPSPVPGSSVSILLVGKTNNCCGTTSYMDLTLNGLPAQSKLCNRFNCTFTTTALLDGLNQVALSLGKQTSIIAPYFNYMQIAYTSYLVPQNNKLDITLGNYNGRARIEITDNFDEQPIILNIANPRKPVQLSGFDRSSGKVTFETQLSLLTANRFLTAAASQAVAPVSITKTVVNDIRPQQPQADLIIVTARSLATQLNEYVDYRQGQGYGIHIVTVEDIIDNFGYGLYDPTAIRDYLKYAYENFPTPAPYAALFAGDANYDFLNRLGTNQRNYVPVYIQGGDASYSDDNYVYFGSEGILVGDTANWTPDQGFDMMAARWPVKTGSEINAIVDKIKAYESTNNFGTWRNDIVLVADDEYTRTTSNETFHTTQTETLEKTIIPRRFNREKLYLWEYSFVNREKPAVNDAIVKAFNDGALVINYVGHGNPEIWAHEGVFKRSSDLPRLANSDKLALVFAASCAIGFFDDPKRQGMGEDLLSMTNGGAIAVVAASRLVYSFDNSEYNKKVYEVMLNSDSLSICEAVYTAKLLRQYRNGRFQKVLNDQQYVYFGDPFVKLGMPQMSVALDVSPDSLTALGRTKVSGRVVDDLGNTIVEDGTLSISVLDSDRQKVHRLISGGVVTQIIPYKVTGPTLFKGTATVTNGAFDFEFVTPVDVGYGGNEARLLLYAKLGSVDAAGLVDSITINDSVANVADSAGPQITYSVIGRENFVSGDKLSKGEKLKISLADSSGINLSGALGHGITIEIDGDAANLITLTEQFTYEPDNFTTGTVVYSLDSLSSGHHSLKIKAWDNANNSAATRLEFSIVADGTVAINDLLNYPNPMVDLTTFYFELTQAVERFNLDIFTLSGRKIKSYSQYGLGADNYPNGSFGLTWDGRDTDGDRVATGVYIYKATAVPEAGGEPLESFGKIVVINQ